MDNHVWPTGALGAQQATLTATQSVEAKRTIEDALARIDNSISQLRNTESRLHDIALTLGGPPPRHGGKEDSKLEDDPEDLRSRMYDSAESLQETIDNIDRYISSIVDSTGKGR